MGSVGPQVGERAPDFVLPDQYGQPVQRADFADRRRLLVMFYPFAFTGVCSGELAAIRDAAAEFAALDTAVVSISCDSMHTLKAYSTEERFTHPLLSDFWPHGAVSRQFGVLVEDKGYAARGSFLLDREGIVRWQIRSAIGDARDVREYLAAASL